MATAINLEAEQQAIITILNSRESKQHLVGKLLGSLTVEHFGSDAGNEVMAKITAHMRRGKGIPGRENFVLDQSLSEDAREFLQNISIKPLKRQESVEGLIDILNFHRKIRRILSAAREMTDACKKATADDIAAIESKLDQLTIDVKGKENNTKIITFGSGDRSQADDVISRITSGIDAKRIPTGFDYFDSRAGGARKGHAFLIAGPSGGGKSALANQLLINMYVKAHRKTLFVSFEMDDEECISRMASNVSGLEFSKVEKKKLSVNDAAVLHREIENFHKIGVDNDCWFKVWPPDSDLTAANVIAYARPIKPDVMVVDYIGLLGQDNTREEQWKALGSAMRQFKIAAKKLDCCIIVLAQFDQDAMVVKYARALREHANIMWCWTYGEMEKATGIVTIRQTAPYGKNRNSEPFDFRLKYELKLMRIIDHGAADPSEMKLQQKSGRKIPQQDGVARLKVAKTQEQIFEEE